MSGVSYILVGRFNVASCHFSIKSIISTPSNTTAKSRRWTRYTTVGMPGQIIDRPNPRPLPSNIDDHVLSLAVKLEKARLQSSVARGLQEFRRAANYIAAGLCAPGILG